MEATVAGVVFRWKLWNVSSAIASLKGKLVLSECAAAAAAAESPELLGDRAAATAAIPRLLRACQLLLQRPDDVAAVRRLVEVAVQTEEVLEALPQVRAGVFHLVLLQLEIC